MRLILLATVLAQCALPGQKAPPTTDPYTGAKAAAMRRAGYVTFEPVGLRPTVVKALPQSAVLFVETQHFVLGTTLRATRAPLASAPRRRFGKELAGIRVRIPGIPKRPRTIDPWLHLHLYAARLEALYGEMQFLLRVTDADFPDDATAARRVPPEKSMGYGPYLGMRGKYRVLILQTRDEIARVQQALTGNAANPGSFHHIDSRAGSLVYVNCVEIYEEQIDPNLMLRSQIRFNVAKNLLKGYRHFGFELPTWVSEGVGNLLLRDSDPTQFAYGAIRGGGEPTARNARWKVNSRNLVKNGLAPKAADLCVASSPAGFSLNDHITCWSRLDYLRSLDEGRLLAGFLRRLKQPIPTTGKPRGQAVLEAQEAAFRDLLKMSFAEFDAGWASYVSKTYPRR